MFKNSTNKSTYNPESKSVYESIDDIFDSMDSVFSGIFDNVPPITIYPPHDIITSKDGEKTKIVLAVAGYKEEDISLEFENNNLVVKGKKQESEYQDSEEWQIVQNGISKKQFAIKFKVKRSFDVESAEIANGILTITLARIPGSKKEIPISVKK
jgi:molecular chaperone IbpA